MSHLFDNGPLPEFQLAPLVYSLSLVMQKHMRHKPKMGDSNHIEFDIKAKDIRMNEELRVAIDEAIRNTTAVVYPQAGYAIR